MFSAGFSIPSLYDFVQFFSKKEWIFIEYFWFARNLCWEHYVASLIQKTQLVVLFSLGKADLDGIRESHS